MLWGGFDYLRTGHVWRRSCPRERSRNATWKKPDHVCALPTNNQSMQGAFTKMTTPDTNTLAEQLRSYANTLGLGWIAEAADCIAEQVKYRDLLDRQIDDLTNDFNGLCEINKSLSERNESLEALCSEQAKQLEDLRQVDIEILRQEVFSWKALCEKGDKAIDGLSQRIQELESQGSISSRKVYE